jgi:rod shape-determining protein MreB
LAAKAMLGRTPGSITAIRPMKDGVIADFDITQAMLGYFIKKVHGNRTMAHPRVVIAVPSGITAVEKRAVLNSAERAGARRVYLVEEPKAAGIGAGLPIHEPRASMIADIGGGTTEVAVISLGGIVISRSIRTAGDEVDEATVAFARSAFNLFIGERMAERAKILVGSAFPLDEERRVTLRGRDLLTGLPKEVEVSSVEMREGIAGPVNRIVEEIRAAIEETPPELLADIMEHGIVLAGGGALLLGLDRRLAHETKINVRIADDPMTCVARGCGAIVENFERYRTIILASQRVRPVPTPA